jgi:hypothetical protein
MDLANERYPAQEQWPCQQEIMAREGMAQDAPGQGKGVRFKHNSPAFPSV